VQCVALRFHSSYIFVLIMRNIGVTWLIILGKEGGGNSTMGIRNFLLRRSYFRKRENIGKN
jgi:hypothetical protein